LGWNRDSCARAAFKPQLGTTQPVLRLNPSSGLQLSSIARATPLITKSWVGGWCFSCVVRGSLVGRSSVDGVVVVGVRDHLAHSKLANDARVTARAATPAATPKIDLARDQIVPERGPILCRQLVLKNFSGTTCRPQCGLSGRHSLSPHAMAYRPNIALAPARSISHAAIARSIFASLAGCGLSNVVRRRSTL
jgi:hypothetical protein